MLRSVSVVDEYELVDAVAVLELLLEIMEQFRRQIPVDVDDTLELLQFRCARQFIRNLIVDIVYVCRLVRVDIHFFDEFLDVKHVEVLQVYNQLFQLLCWFRSYIYIHNRLH